MLSEYTLLVSKGTTNNVIPRNIKTWLILCYKNKNKEEKKKNNI